MYSLQSALAIGKDLGARWTSVELGNIVTSVIFNGYRKVYLTLSNPMITDPVVIDFDTLRTEFSASPLTLNNLLISLGDRTLVAMTTPPALTTKFAHFSDLFRAGYKIEVMNANVSVTAQLPPSSKTSLRISRNNPATDMSVFFDNCLVSINGFFHRTDTDRQYTYILDANDSLFPSKQNQIGAISFLDIGKIEQVAITPDMIIPQADGSPLKNKTFLKLGRDLTDKTVMLVLGGYLMFVDNKALLQNGLDTFVLNFNAIPLLDRYFESRPYINLNELDLPVSTDNPSLINVPDFFSDANLIKYMTLQQSFFVILDSPSIFTNKIFIRESNLPGMFTAYSEPKYPLFVNNGRIAEYWKVQEDGYWSVTVQDSYLRNNIFSSKPQDQLVNVSDSMEPTKPAYNSRGFLLEIGSDRI